MSNKIILELTQDDFAEIISCCDAAHNEFSDEGSLAMANKLREMDTSPDKVVITRKLLEKLTPEQPIVAMGWYCEYCTGENMDLSGRVAGNHATDCPWIAARKLLGDELS